MACAGEGSKDSGGKKQYCVPEITYLRRKIREEKIFPAAEHVESVLQLP